MSLAKFDPIGEDLPLSRLLELYRDALIAHVEAKNNRRRLRELGLDDEEYQDAQYVEDKAEILVNVIDRAMMVNMYLGKREKYG